LTKKLLILLWFGFLGQLLAFAQELPPVQNFNPVDYNAQNQNWSITQDRDKTIYLANNKGLLEYNGAKWNLYTSPNETIMRSVSAVGERIYTGCYREFGFWERDEFGILQYTSISKTINVDLKEDEEIWKILNYDKWVIFQSLQSIYIFDTSNESLRVVEGDHEIVNMFLVRDAIFYQERGKGIFKISNGEKIPIDNQDVLKADEVVNVFQNDLGYIIVTRNNGFYLLADNTLSEWPAINQNLSDYSIYSCIQTKNGNYVVGTISNGLLLLNPQGTKIAQFNQENSLPNNTVLSIFEDSDENLWIGLDNGISLINIDSPVQVFQDINGTLGSVYATAIVGDLLYLGTNQGLYYKRLEGDNEFTFVRGTKGQVWSLKLIQGVLFCGHHQGTFVIEKDIATLIAPIHGTWDFEPLGSGEILQGNYDGLYVLDQADGAWGVKNKLAGFNNSSRHFVYANDKIFVNHEYKGVFQLEIDKQLTRVLSVKMDTILKSANSSLTSYDDQILYGYKDGILRYNEEMDHFEKDTILSKVYTETTYLSGTILKDEDRRELWSFTKDNLTRVSFDNLVNAPKISTIPLVNDIRREVTEFENIIQLSDGSYLLGTSYGYIKFDIDRLEVPDFSIGISRISNGTNLNQGISSNLIDKHKESKFETNQNSLNFDFHTSSYQSYFNPIYQYRLIGIYDRWSEWSTEASVFYQNLPPGKYEFEVRSKVGNKVSENAASFKFSIAKPWYATNIMIAIYVLIVIVFSIFMHHVYKAYYKKQQRKLIEENQKELDLTRLQNEKEIMELKNNQLQQENRSKSNELAASTMSIIKKNELLNQIKEQLGKVKDTKIVRPVIKTIDQNLNQRKNWELFQEAFNNADRDFFKKVTEVHPDLSPNDLKLCAYLRLNLSSKEIAGLINISPRSVEVKRYRLRKKLGLDNNENLANYIINL